MNKRKIMTIAVIAISVIAAIVNIIVLPDQVGMQLSSSGTLNNIVPKYVAILIPIVVSGGSVLLMNVKKVDTSRNNDIRLWIAAWLGVILQITTLVINKIAA